MQFENRNHDLARFESGAPTHFSDFSNRISQNPEILIDSRIFAIKYFNIRSKVGEFYDFSPLDPETLVSGVDFEFWVVSTYIQPI